MVRWVRRAVMGLWSVNAVRVGLLVLVGVGWAVPAAAQVVGSGRPAWSAAVLAPRDYGLVRGGSVRVVLRLDAGVRSLRVRVGRRDVTADFSRRGSERVGVLRVGSGLGWGVNSVNVRTAGGPGRVWYQSVRVVMLRRAGGRLGGWSNRGRAIGGPPPPPTQLRVAAPRAGSVIWAYVNGARRPVALSGPGRLRSRTLSADDGLRPGVNRIRVESIEPRQGRYTTSRFVLRLSPRMPVAGAGPDRRGPVGRTLVGDGGASVAAGRASRLVYHWAIVSRPAGSHARLSRASSRRPALRPDRPGDYVLRLVVSEVPRHHGTRPVAGLGSVAQATDFATFTAVPAVGPIGVPIDTIATTVNGVRGVQVGSSFYASQPDEPLQLVILNRSDTSLLLNAGFANDAQGASLLQKAISGAQQAYNLTLAPLVIVTKPNPGLSSPGASASVSALANVLRSMGVNVASPTVLAGTTACGLPNGGQCSAFSAIGIPGLPGGQGNVNPGLGSVASTGAAPGDLHGFLQQDITPEGTIPTAENSAGGAVGDTPPVTYSFVNRERVAFDTGDPSADPATVTVNGTSYGSGTVPKTPGGFFVVVLDAGSLRPRTAPQTFLDSAAAGAGNLSAMASFLAPYTGDPTALVIVRTVGNVSRIPSGWWDSVGNALAQLGGSRIYFNYLNGSSSPALAQVGLGGGSPGFPSDTTQLATQERTGTTRLSGLLARNQSSELYPAESTPPGTPLDQTLNGLIADPTATAPWPNETMKGYIAASNCIAQNIYGGTVKLTLPLESNYTSNIIWSSLLPKLDNDFTYAYLTAPPLNCTDFSEKDLADVKTMLDSIWPEVDRIHQLIGILQQPFLTTNASNAVYNAVHAVNQTIPTPASVHTNWLSIASDVLWATASAFEGPVANLLNAASAGLSLAGTLVRNTDGSSALTDVTIPGDQLADQLRERYTNAALALGRAGDIIVSDYRKLDDAYENAAPHGIWDTTNATATVLSNAMVYPESREAFLTLFPARFALYRTQQGPDAPKITNVTQYRCEQIIEVRGRTTFVQKIGWWPFSGDPQYAGSSPPTTAGGPLEQWAYAQPGFDADNINGPGPVYPSNTVLSDMFTSQPAQNGVSTPLFNTTNFPLEAYNGGARAYTITQHNASATIGNLSTTEQCSTSPSPNGPSPTSVRRSPRFALGRIAGSPDDDFLTGRTGAGQPQGSPR